jgi:hypothetical protein
LKFNVQDAEVKKGHNDHAKREGPSFKNTSEYINAKSKILEIYGKPKAVIAANPNKLSRELEKYLGPKKDQWTLEQLRVLWDPLGSGESKRTRSESHETTWLNLAGYMLRPGYGDLLDAYRVAELWKVFEKGLAFPKCKQTQSQWWIMWRRVAGGLNRSQQETLFAKISPLLRKGVLHPELYLLAGSLELVSMDKKVKLADRLVEQVYSQKTDHVRQKIWAISRMASRVPLYGGPEHIIRPSFVERWIDKLIDLDINQSEYRMLHQFFIQSCRMIGNREFDINFSHRQKVLAKIADQKDFQYNKQLLTSVVPMDAKSSSVLFGESLPSGFII